MARSSPLLRPALAVAISAAILLALALLRHRPGALSGDEGTYVAMAESLVRDRDLGFSEADAAKYFPRPSFEGAGAILLKPQSTNAVKRAYLGRFRQLYLQVRP